jgi:AcrR family transcriptional regulator
MTERPAYPVAARALLRDTLLDAAADLLRDRAWGGVTMAEIARGAGVSRQTLYNEFGDRQGVAQAYLLREADRFLSAAEQAIAAHPGDPRGALTAAFDGFLSRIADHPVIQAILHSDGADGLVVLVTTQGGPILSLATERLATFLGTAWPRLEASGARVAAETFVRLAISHAALPTSPPRRTAAALAAVLGPHLEELYRSAPAAEVA